MKIQKDLGITFIVVTHDQEEAMTLSDRVGVMDRGQITQVGPPRELYEQPNSLFIANFLGALNSFTGRVISSADGFSDVKLADADLSVNIAAEIPVEDEQRVVVTVRPEKLEVFADAEGKPGTRNSFKGVVENIAYMGHLTVYRVKLEAGITLNITEPNHHMSAKSGIREGDVVRTDWPARSSGLFSA